ncbi:MAG: Ig-like domain-containing domain [Paludibacter sp.]|nr:Ig-like domain-containing domain [Paludibacter sp.]
MKYFRLIIQLVLVFTIVSCANRAAGPTGGPKDSIPPVVLRTIPVNNALNYKKKEIQVFFDENVSLEKVNENVIISPPQKTQPIVKANARVLTVSIQDDLQDSTTYSILFGNAIVDLNEKNPLPNYTFSFATGQEIDTLQVSGKLINAENLDPMPGVLVGLHKNLHDTAILRDQFTRVAKTDDEGRFTIQNIKEGKYKLYALTDLNRDFYYQPGEGIAFYDSIVIPQIKVVQQTDTLWKDSITIDTIKTESKLTYLPDDLVMKLFKESKKRQYLVKSERPAEKYFHLFFNDRQDSLPKIEPINFELNTQFLIQKTERKDSLVYWIPDSAVYKQDTLSMAVSYLKSDSLFQLVSTIDTLKLVLRKPKTTVKTKDGKPKLITPLTFKTNLAGNFDLYRDIQIEFEEPLDSIHNEKIKLVQKVDSIFNPINFTWLPLDSIRRKFLIRHVWKPEEEYELRLDSAAFISIYNRSTNEQKTPFKIKSLDEYSALKIILQKYDSLVVLQVLDSKETVVQTQKAKPKGNLFKYLKPGDYFVRLFVDNNQNGLWDPGDLEKRRQAEAVCYFNKKMTLKANWEIEESWNHLDPAMLNKKPEELLKEKKK